MTTAVQLAQSVAPGVSLGFKNRIINGGMTIDQRNAGASGTGIGNYTVDRWYYGASQASKLTWQQNAGSVTPPAGFTNYFGFTSSSAYSIGSNDYFLFTQYIEGYNVSDLSWGTANAKAVTLSFQVRSSLTGTFGGALCNSDASRSYPFTYTISAANTWEQKSITISGDTSGTWLTTSGVGIQLRVGLGNGSTYSGTAGSWASANYGNATGATSVVGTNGATFYITGVQLEVGTAATPFEFRDYTRELQMCQRYYETSYPAGTAVGTNIGSDVNSYPMLASVSSSTGWSSTLAYKVTKRAVPTVTPYTRSGTSGQFYWGVYGVNESAVATVVNQSNVNGCNFNTSSAPNAGSNGVYGQWTASAEL